MLPAEVLGWVKLKFGPVEHVCSESGRTEWQTSIGLVWFVEHVDGSTWNEIGVVPRVSRYSSDAELARDLHRICGAAVFFDIQDKVRAGAGRVVILEHGGEREAWDPSLE